MNRFLPTVIPALALIGMAANGITEGAEPIRDRGLLNGHQDFVYSLAFSPDGKSLASGSADGTVKIWDFAAGKERATLSGHEKRAVRAIAYASDGNTLASGDSLGVIKLWNLSTGKETFALLGHLGPDNAPRPGPVNSLAFSPDGKLLVSASEDRTIKIWEAATGKELHTLSRYKDKPGDLPFTAVAFSPDGKTLASGVRLRDFPLPDMNRIVFWDVATAKERGGLIGHKGSLTALAYSPDGKILASCGNDDTYVKFWDAESTKMLAVLPGHIGKVTCIAFSADGKKLASGDFSGNLRLWTIPTGKELTVDGVRIGSIWSLAFCPDGKTLATGSYGEKSIRLWTLDGEKPTAAAPAKVVLRFDGLYQSKNAKYDWLRFYDDGTFIDATTAGGTPEQVAKWFDRKNESMTRGKYTINGAKVAFTIVTPRGNIEYEGVLTGERILLNYKSLITGNKGEEEYHFVKPEEKGK
jgi:WD40 repeat protein